VTDEEISNLRQSAREGWRYADELEQERKRLTGEAAVMRSLLRRCNAVLLNIEPESAAEHEAIGELSDAVERAIGDAKGTLL